MLVTSVVGARPQFVKLAPMCRAFKELGIEHHIVHTGQHYDLNMSDSFFEELNIPAPDHHLGVGSGSHGIQTGSMLQELDPIFLDTKPDCVLAYGDTNSTIAAALSAVKLHIGLAHLEAGLRSFNRRMPEEHNRVLTDHAADLCLAPTELAIKNLAHEGLSEKSILTGDVMTDVCLQTARKVEGQQLFAIEDLPDGKFALATIHRADNTDDAEQLSDIINQLKQLSIPVLLTAHPRLVAKCKDHGISLSSPNLRVVDPLPYPILVNTVQRAELVITDSGGLQKEAFLLRTPCITLRTETEWVETINLGWNVLCSQRGAIESSMASLAPADTSATPYGDGAAAIATAHAIKKKFA